MAARQDQDYVYKKYNSFVKRLADMHNFLSKDEAVNSLFLTLFDWISPAQPELKLSI
jgi:hypothetical protein